jgi:hypothetical protein
MTPAADVVLFWDFRSRNLGATLGVVAELLRKPPFTYNIAEFVSREVEIDTDLIPMYEDETAARAAGHAPGDIFRKPGGTLGMVGVIPPDGRE